MQRARLEIQELLGLPALQAQQVLLVILDQLGLPEVQELPGLPAPQAQQVQLVTLDQLVLPEVQELPDLPVPQAQPVLQEVLALRVQQDLLVDVEKAK